ncbi:MAG: hypothetical protein ACLFVZ_06390, partial [Actinomycetota bacterium]
MSEQAVLAAALTSLAVGLMMRQIVPPPRRLRGRVDPYLSPSLSIVNGSRDAGPVRSVFGPMIRDLADWVGRQLDRSGSGVTILRLRQAGWFKGQSEPEMLSAYRIAQLKAVTGGLALAVAMGHVVGATIHI